MWPMDGLPESNPHMFDSVRKGKIAFLFFLDEKVPGWTFSDKL